MHKKLEAELVSLAHSILQMKNKDDVGALHKKAQDLSEKLSLLKFVNEYINTTPQAVETKTEIIDKIETVLDEEEKIEEKVVIEEVVAEALEEEDVIGIVEDKPIVEEKVEEELEELIISDDIVFERVVGENTIVENEEPVFEKAVLDEVEKQDEFEDIVFEKVEETKLEQTEIVEPIFERAVLEEAQEEVKMDDIVFEKVVENAKNEEVDTKEQLFEKATEEQKDEEILTQDKDPFVKKEMFTHDEVAEIFGTKGDMIKDEESNLASMQFTLEDELTETTTTDPDPVRTVFEKEPKVVEKAEDKGPAKPRSLNDVLFTSNLQVGLNDRIAFVKHLFDGSQEDFNRVLSQLNSFKSEDEAKNFIDSFVKPEYNWDGKEEYEDRLLNIIERKFL